MRIKTDLIARRELIDKLVLLTQEKLKSFPQGCLKIKKHDKRIYYYRDDGSNRDKIIPKTNLSLAKQLAQRNYLENVLKAAKEESIFLSEIIDKYPKQTAEDVYSQLSPERRNIIRPIQLPDDEFIREWQAKPYTPKPFKKDTPVYITMRGERVRSKSEMIIADRLYINNIPYKYECPITINGITFHPDFTILRIQDRKDLYLEHCGKIGDEGYSDDLVDRITMYSENGIIVGDRLFLTFETANKPFDARTIDRLICEVFTQNQLL